ncbi:MAG: nucleotidyl transferase AbiEii/AbiGii toxin family protein [Bacteroidales bacterium]|nr:nucleotidyl transferase AbiEii/AbiGii toxin family protein [Bacteroidales bacterium]
MILQKEVIEIAERSAMPKSTIDKDWVLGHFLNAFYGDEFNRKHFVFKGGTCLKKCHFKKYRFSEDLDFTLINPEIDIDRKFFNKIISITTEKCGIQFHINSFKKQVFNDIPQGYKVVIKFWGADHKPNQPPLPWERWLTKIEIDITFTEKIITPYVEKSIYHEYSDRELVKNIIPVYSIEEILAEKLRSFFQRSYPAPRDFYDVWYICNNVDIPDWKSFRNLFNEKMAVKNQKYDVNIFRDKFVKDKVSKAWYNSLGNHLKPDDLPKPDEVFEFLNTFVVEKLK